MLTNTVGGIHKIVTFPMEENITRFPLSYEHQLHGTATFLNGYN